MYYWKEFIEDINKSIKENQLVFDAGAGDGHWRKNLNQNIKYISMDLGVGDAKVDYSHLDIKGDLRNIPLENESVDVIINIQVLEHVPEPWKVLAEFSRILKPGGKLFLSCPQSVEMHQVPYDFYRYTKFGLTFLMESNGLKIEWMKPQLGNFSHIISDTCYSLRMLPKLGKNKISRFLWKCISVFFIQIYGKIIKPLTQKIDRNPIFQDNSTGYFLKAIKK
jgi:ubiquinone/menaquinone biosynthesis C-methylase UbiE